MPGGKKNIKPSDNPKPFQKGNKAAEEWNEEKALQLGQEMLDWYKADEMNIYIDQFIVEIKDLNPHLPSYLANKFTTFKQLYDKCYAIRKRKLLSNGTFGAANPSMVKFDLVNHHGMFSENTKSDITTNGNNINSENNIDYSKLSDAALREIANIISKPSKK